MTTDIMTTDTALPPSPHCGVAQDWYGDVASRVARPRTAVSRSDGSHLGEKR